MTGGINPFFKSNIRRVWHKKNQCSSTPCSINFSLIRIFKMNSIVVLALISSLATVFAGHHGGHKGHGSRGGYGGGYGGHSGYGKREAEPGYGSYGKREAEPG